MMVVSVEEEIASKEEAEAPTVEMDPLVEE